jgi:hypothetical protein
MREGALVVTKRPSFVNDVIGTGQSGIIFVQV